VEWNSDSDLVLVFCQKADEVPPGMLFVNAGRADVETRTGSDRKLKANLQGRMDGLC